MRAGRSHYSFTFEWSGYVIRLTWGSIELSNTGAVRMSFLSKFVAIVLMFLLAGAQAFAAGSCSPRARMSSHRCCEGLTGEARMGMETLMESRSGKTLASPSCCQMAQKQPGEWKQISETQEPSTTAVIPIDTASTAAIAPVLTPRNAWYIPDRAGTSTIQSRLCTFRI